MNTRMPDERFDRLEREGLDRQIGLSGLEVRELLTEARRARTAEVDLGSELDAIAETLGTVHEPSMGKAWRASMPEMRKAIRDLKDEAASLRAELQSERLARTCSIMDLADLRAELDALRVGESEAV